MSSVRRELPAATGATGRLAIGTKAASRARYSCNPTAAFAPVLAVVVDEDGDLLGPEARLLEVRVRRHLAAGTAHFVRMSVLLYRLQEGRAHRLKGYDSFDAYASREFPGLSESSARQYASLGATLLRLAHARDIAVEDAHRSIGSTGLRALRSVGHRHGDASMLKVFDRAQESKPGRPVTDRDVNRAARAVLHPPSQNNEHPNAALPVTDAQPLPTAVPPAVVEETLDVAALPQDMLDLVRQVEELLEPEWDGRLGDDERADVIDALNRLERRLARLRERVGAAPGVPAAGGTGACESVPTTVARDGECLTAGLDAAPSEGPVDRELA